MRWTAFTGRLGERGTDWQGEPGALGTLTVSTTRPLRPGAGLTVVAELPVTAVDPPSANTLLWYEILDNRQWIIGGIGLLVVLIYYIAAWNAVGRDPKRGTVIPLFHPPQGISPALANYIHNWGLTREKWRAFTAAALSLAVKGLIRLNYSGSALTLKTTQNDPQGRVPLSSEERAIVTKLNASGGSLPIDRSHGATVADLGSKFTSAVELENRNRFFRRNVGYVIVGFVITAAVVAWEIMFGGLQDRDISILVVLGFVGFFIGMFIVPVVQAMHSGSARFNVVVWIAVALAFVSVFVNGLHALLGGIVNQGWPALRDFMTDDPFPFVLVAAFTSVNGLFLYLMKAPTALGRPIMDQLDGFRLYLETAEADRLNMQAPEITADRFEALLPYAVALDVEKPWADAFGAALRRAHPDDRRSDAALPARLEQRRRLVGRQFRRRGCRDRRRHVERLGERGAGFLRLIGIRRRRRRLGRRWWRRRRGRLVARPLKRPRRRSRACAAARGSARPVSPCRTDSPDLRRSRRP